VCVGCLFFKDTSRSTPCLIDLDVFDHEDSDYDSDTRRNIRPEVLSASLTFVSSNVPVEIMVFIFYSDEITINVKTGLVLRHNN